MSWLINVFYLLLLACLSPFWLYRRYVRKKLFGNWREKLFGELPSRGSSNSNGPCLWVHAVSVGEVVQLKSVLSTLRERIPAADILITTTTTTGHAVANRLYPEYSVAYFPLDFSWAVHRALDRVRPDLIVLVELELWPNFVRIATDRGTPLAVINGRLSERSFRGYSRIRPVMKSCLHRLSFVAVQSQTYAERFRRLGAQPDRLHVTGSIKFDHVQTNRLSPATETLRQLFDLDPDTRVFIAGSTQAPEEQFALETYRQLRDTHPELRLILVPRHQERFDEVANLVTTLGFSLCRRSHLEEAGRSGTALEQEPRENGSEPPVMLLDTLGELSACWGLADIAFVGGSLTRRGGQNMIEPAGFGAALLFGPNTQNFRDVVALLLEGNAAHVVQSPTELTAHVAEFLNHPESMRASGARAQELVLTQRGATDRTVDLLVALLPGEESAPNLRAA